MSETYTHNCSSIDTSLALYETEVGQIPRISREEEEQLLTSLIQSKKAKKGDKSPRESCRSELQTECNEKVRARLISGHLWLVIYLAKKFKVDFGRIDVNDLIQAGNIGLLIALDRFNPEMGVRFSTYASHWINKFIVEEYQQQRWLIRLPDRKMRMISKKNKIQNDLYLRFGREPEFKVLTATVAEIEGITTAQAEKLLQNIAALEENIVSLDLQVGEDQESSLVELLQDRNSPEPFKSVTDVLMSDQFSKVLPTLNEKEVLALELLYGFENGYEHTFEEVGKRLHITGSAVRLMEAKALRKLRHPTRSRKLRDFLD